MPKKNVFSQSLRKLSSVPQDEKMIKMVLSGFRKGFSSGKLKKPENVSKRRLKSDLDFYGIKRKDTMGAIFEPVNRRKATTQDFSLAKL